MPLDDSNYLTNHEAALAVVATAMKKSRYRLDTLIISSFMGGTLFTAGGMLHIIAQAENPQLFENNPGLVHLLQGALYPIGLFFVVIMGTDLFNSNILFFTVGLLRRAVSVFDLLISWIVSWLVNLIASIFVAYLFCHFSAIASNQQFVDGSIDILVEKANFSFHETLLKAMACNFFVALGIYLQLMAKPIHVKFLMLFFAVFTFVSMGFTHTVADMFLGIMGLINGAPVSVATFIWKLLIPGTIGNIIGGGFFGLTLPWYLHLVVVERDQRLLNLPKYDIRDEQPELGIDSRVVRRPIKEESVEDQEKREADLRKDSEELTSEEPEQPNESPVGIYADNSLNTSISEYSTTSRRRIQSKRRGSVSSLSTRSPKGVFPVFGMGQPLARERTIASGIDRANKDGDKTDTDSEADRDSEYGEGGRITRVDTVGSQLKRAFTLSSLKSKNAVKKSDIEANPTGPSTPRSSYTRRNSVLNPTVLPAIPSDHQHMCDDDDIENSNTNDIDQRSVDSFAHSSTG